MLIVLLGLGTWQVYRLQWKEAILARIAAAERAPPVSLAETPSPYTKVSVTGRFRFDLTAQFGAEVRDTRSGPTMGFYQIVPLERDGAPTLLVNRGWIPQRREEALNDPPGVVTVTGYIRPGDVPAWFSPADDRALREFYTLDPDAIGAALGIHDVAPFILVMLGSSTVEGYPAPAEHLPRPSNNHLSYVITWYGLAASLAVIFGMWMRKASRS
ncbi:MAG: SURF1 family protein [Rhodopila sp.]|nr:SURF1 family protein [Rhodopila sp.]